MDTKKIERINELYRKSKAEGLTAEEKQEQQKLRMEYRMAIVGNLTASLKNVKIQNPDGTIVDVKPKSEANGKEAN
ncbi:MAG: DUF896 domain-containing protein [Lachnospiraceae bacterium]|nr:DUF896 domain-containing protein [Lachnospiraceae bacterium]